MCLLSMNMFVVSGGGDAGMTGRGAMRGRRPIPVDILTRPKDMHSKKGWNI